MSEAKRKRKTAAQREAEQRSALWQRVYDIYCGANGGAWEEAENGDAEQWADAGILSRVVPALADIFDDENERRYLFVAHNLHHYSNVGSAVGLLYEHGVRA